jgi:hypothetical protein
LQQYLTTPHRPQALLADFSQPSAPHIDVIMAGLISHGYPQIGDCTVAAQSTVYRHKSEKRCSAVQHTHCAEMQRTIEAARKQKRAKLHNFEANSLSVQAIEEYKGSSGQLEGPYSRLSSKIPLEFAHRSGKRVWRSRLRCALCCKRII